jgi:hypothetical protein
MAELPRLPAALPMPAQAAPHMAMQWGPPASPMSNAVTASDVCMKRF